MISVDLIDEEWQLVASNVRTRILAVPNKLGGRLGSEAAAMIRAELYEALTEISETEVPGVPAKAAS